MSLQEYREFIASRSVAQVKSGFKPSGLRDVLKVHQRAVVDFALERGKSAAFLDTGLGKSLIELEWADQVAQETGKPVLILCPLAVAGQMVREGRKFGIDARQVRLSSEVGAGVNVANYERLHLLDPSQFGGVALDESSILKSYGSSTFTSLTEAFKDTPFKLAATATPAPNDHMELGQHAQFLDVMPSNEMLARWFIADQSQMGRYRLKGHSGKSFWAWMASFSRCATMPSDLGGDDAGYELPPIVKNLHVARADLSQDTDGGLFRMPEMSATSFHREKVLTLRQRCELASELANSHDKPVTVWCERDDESALLTSLIRDAREVKGSMSADQKEELLLGFPDGKYRVIVSKPKLAGFGVNWQHCAHAVFGSISFSYEQHYQAERRSHRFGQKEQVVNDVVISETESSVWQTILRKKADHEVMKREMTNAMLDGQNFAGLRIAYGDRDKLKLPEWIVGGSN